MDPDLAERLQHLLLSRHSSRAAFDPARRVAPDEITRIVEAARWAPTAHNMQNFRLIVIDDPAVLQEIGRIPVPLSPVFIAENYRQLAWSPEELKERGIGLLATVFPPSWWVPDPERVPADPPNPLGELIAGSPLMIIVVFDASQRAPASEGDVLGMISLGCVLENMWLAAQAAHLDVQVVSAFAADRVEHEVQRVLAIPSPWRIAYALRIGHAVVPPKAPRVRRDPNVIVHHNYFGRTATADEPSIRGAGSGSCRETPDACGWRPERVGDLLRTC